MSSTESEVVTLTHVIQSDQQNGGGSEGVRVDAGDLHSLLLPLAESLLTESIHCDQSIGQSSKQVLPIRAAGQGGGLAECLNEKAIGLSLIHLA